MSLRCIHLAPRKHNNPKNLHHPCYRLKVSTQENEIVFENISLQIIFKSIPNIAVPGLQPRRGVSNDSMVFLLPHCGDRYPMATYLDHHTLVPIHHNVEKIILPTNYDGGFTQITVPPLYRDKPLTTPWWGWINRSFPLSMLFNPKFASINSIPFLIKITHSYNFKT